MERIQRLAMKIPSNLHKGGTDASTPTINEDLKEFHQIWGWEAPARTASLDMFITLSLSSSENEFFLSKCSCVVFPGDLGPGLSRWMKCWLFICLGLAGIIITAQYFVFYVSLAAFAEDTPPSDIFFKSNLSDPQARQLWKQHSSWHILYSYKYHSYFLWF